MTNSTRMSILFTNSNSCPLIKQIDIVPEWALRLGKVIRSFLIFLDRYTLATNQSLYNTNHTFKTVRNHGEKFWR